MSFSCNRFKINFRNGNASCVIKLTSFSPAQVFYLSVINPLIKLYFPSFSLSTSYTEWQKKNCGKVKWSHKFIKLSNCVCFLTEHFKFLNASPICESVFLEMESLSMFHETHFQLNIYVTKQKWRI